MEAAHGGEYPPPGSPLSGVRAAWFAAAKAGDVAAAAALLAGGAHLDEGGAELRCERGATALMWAAAEGHDALMRLLLAHGCDVEARCSRAGGSALLWAASRNQLTSLRTLLAAGADAGRPAPPRDAHGGWDVQVRRARAPQLRTRSACAFAAQAGARGVQLRGHMLPLRA
jgi:hypothetical protein